MWGTCRSQESRKAPRGGGGKLVKLLLSHLLLCSPHTYDIHGIVLNFSSKDIVAHSNESKSVDPQ